MKDMSRGAHPLDQDQALAEAWQQPAWADYSGVSRTLWACDETTLDAIDTAISDVSAQFIQQEVSLVLSQNVQFCQFCAYIDDLPSCCTKLGVS